MFFGSIVATKATLGTSICLTSSTFLSYCGFTSYFFILLTELQTKKTHKKTGKMNDTGNFVIFGPKANCTLDVRFLNSLTYSDGFFPWILPRFKLNYEGYLLILRPALPSRHECLWLPPFPPSQRGLRCLIHPWYCHPRLSGIQVENTMVYVVLDPELHS
jgi:hypothetical protein